MNLESSASAAGGEIPVRDTGEGDDVSPSRSRGRAAGARGG